MTEKLFIPGPTEIKKDVLEAQTKPMIGHRSQAFTDLYASILNQLRNYFDTEQNIAVTPASGTMFFDITARNLIRTGKKALCCVFGAFSERMYKTIKACGIEADAINVEWGKAVTVAMIEEKLEKTEYDVVTCCHNETSTGVTAPIKEIGAMLKAKYPETLLVVDAVSSLGGDLVYPDEWQTDLIFASTQKAFALPPGLTIAIYSDKAIERGREVPSRGMFTDLVRIHDYYGKKKQTPSTPPISLMYALDYQLGKMLDEGHENRALRHKEMAEHTKKWALDHGFELFAEEGNRSVTVTTISNTKGLDFGELKGGLAKKGFSIANGYGALKGKTFRIGHMGDHTMGDLKELLKAIESVWGL